jgi:hypothetical protein
VCLDCVSARLASLQQNYRHTAFIRRGFDVAPFFANVKPTSVVGGERPGKWLDLPEPIPPTSGPPFGLGCRFIGCNRCPTEVWWPYRRSLT